MAGVAGQLAPLPDAIYGVGTMTQTDLYPMVRGIGGVRSQDWTIPAFAEGIAAQRSRAVALGAAEDHVNLTTPAGWLALFVVLLIIGSWATRGR